MAKYIIKNNLPLGITDFRTSEWNNAKQAKWFFNYLETLLSDKYTTKVVFRTKPLRGTIQVEIDGFYYYVELYKEL